MRRGWDDFLGIDWDSSQLWRGFAWVLGAFLTYAARKNGEATRDLIRGMEERMSRHFTEVLERMDRQADERHREVIEAIQALRTA